MARLVYACRFEVPGTEAWGSIVAPAYETWVNDRYSRAHGAEIAIDMRGASVTGSLPPDHALSIDAYEADGVARRITWAFPGDQGLIWTNTIRMASLAACCVVEHQVHLQSSDYLVAPPASAWAHRSWSGPFASSILSVWAICGSERPYIPWPWTGSTISWPYSRPRCGGCQLC